MDIEDTILKHTGHHVSATTLLAAHRHPLGILLANAVERAAYAVGQADADLTRVATGICDTLDRVRRTVAAPPGEPVRSLNPLGELQAHGPRVDALIAARDDRIHHLRIATALWRKFSAVLAPADLGPALAEAGFTPITPAHPSTRAAYGHRDGDRQVTVSLHPYGEPGAEVTLCRGDVVAWTVTAGPDVPDSVTTAVVYTALAEAPTDAGPDRQSGGGAGLRPHGRT